MPLIAVQKNDLETEETARGTPLSQRGFSMFGIAAGGASGAVIGFVAAGAFSASAAALAGIIAGLLLGWQAARLTEPKTPAA